MNADLICVATVSHGTKSRRCGRAASVYYELGNNSGKTVGPIGRCDFHPWKEEPNSVWHILRVLTPEMALVESVQES